MCYCYIVADFPYLLCMALPNCFLFKGNPPRFHAGVCVNSTRSTAGKIVVAKVVLQNAVMHTAVSMCASPLCAYQVCCSRRLPSPKAFSLSWAGRQAEFHWHPQRRLPTTVTSVLKIDQMAWRSTCRWGVPPTSSQTISTSLRSSFLWILPRLKLTDVLIAGMSGAVLVHSAREDRCMTICSCQVRNDNTMCP